MNKMYAIVLLICLVMASFSSQLPVFSHTDHCQGHIHNADYTAMHEMCSVCDCVKKTSVLSRLQGTATRSVPFLLGNLFPSMAFLYVMASLYGLHTLISLKIRMNN